jgi:hypothetical protein
MFRRLLCTTLAACVQYAGLLKAMKPQDIINFIFFPVVNEGCRVIAEGARASQSASQMHLDAVSIQTCA